MSFRLLSASLADFHTDGRAVATRHLFRSCAMFFYHARGYAGRAVSGRGFLLLHLQALTRCFRLKLRRRRTGYPNKPPVPFSPIVSALLHDVSITNVADSFAGICTATVTAATRSGGLIHAPSFACKSSSDANSCCSLPWAGCYSSIVHFSTSCCGFSFSCVSSFFASFSSAFGVKRSCWKTDTVSFFASSLMILACNSSDIILMLI